MSANSGVSTKVHFPFGVDMGMGTELAASAGVGMGTRVLWVAGGLRVACS